MVRNIWIAVGGMLWSASVVLAQLPPGAPPMPYGNPGAYGYPGYPMPSYGMPPMNPAPMPYGYPMPAYGMPASRPMPYAPAMTTPIPPDPRRPLPVHDEAGPRKGATEPYLVGPEKAPAAPPAQKLPPAAKTPVPTPAGPAQVYESAVELAELGPMGPPAEPYTLYEGRRYLAEVKNDDVCVFGTVGYVHWWTHHDSAPYLATTGPAGNPKAGTVGDPTTQTLLGNGAVAPHEFSGIQATFGVWLDPERLTSLELGGFYLGKNSLQYAFGSDATGTPVVTRPISTLPPGATNFVEAVHVVAAPGIASGVVNVSSIMNLAGAEANIGRNLIRLNGFSLDYLVGLRYLYLNDTLGINETSTLLPGGAGATFLGVPQPAGATFGFNDSFNLTNRFYGGQIGLRTNWVCCNKLDVGATVKVAFGETFHTAIIDGSTSLTNAAGTTTAPGGILAQPSNIGNHNVSDFSVVPEANFTVGYQIHCNVRLFAGYTVLYWSHVERAAEQIDRRISPGQAPNDFAAGTVGTNPQFLNSRTDFWAQGLNLGFELKY